MISADAPASRLWIVAGVLAIGAWFIYFTSDGLWAPFSSDDLMNLHGYLSKPAHTILLDNLRYWSAAYRPLGGLFYTSLYWAFGFDPLPFRIVCFLLLGFNLVLLFWFCRLLTGSNEVAFIATFLASYHAWFVDLYHSSGTVYELLCFAFYFLAFSFYIQIRRSGKLLTWRESIAVAGLYICALNAKEMAVTFPLFIAIYELLYNTPRTMRSALRWPLVEGRFASVAALLTIPYVVGKLTGAGSLVENPPYQFSISAGRFLDTFHLYLNPLLYQEHVFRDPNTVRLLVAMFVLAAWRRSRSLLFAWLFLLLSLLPVAFINHYSAFFLYIPSVGWALYAGELLVAILRLLSGWIFSLTRRRRADAFVAASLFVLLACVLGPLHTRERTKTLQLFRSAQFPSREVAAELMRLQPEVKKRARILFIDDPFPKDQYELLFLVRLLYNDMTIEVTRTSVQPLLASEYQNYDVVFLCGGKMRVWSSYNPV